MSQFEIAFLAALPLRKAATACMLDAMDANKTALERAFELARSGKFNSVGGLRDAINREGYAGSQITGRVISRQLNEIMKTANAHRT